MTYCNTLTPGHDGVQKVTLIPRGQAHGLTWFIPGDFPTLISRKQLFSRIVGGLGGRVVEEVIFGESEVTIGASSDLQMVTSMQKIGKWMLVACSNDVNFHTFQINVIFF